MAVFHPELSVPPAGSNVVSPVANVADVPPMSAAVPLPMDGEVVPVVVFPSGVTLLKFHCAKTTGLVTKTVSVATELVTLPAMLVTTTE